MLVKPTFVCIINAVCSDIRNLIVAPFIYRIIGYPCALTRESLFLYICSSTLCFRSTTRNSGRKVKARASAHDTRTQKLRQYFYYTHDLNASHFVVRHIIEQTLPYDEPRLSFFFSFFSSFFFASLLLFFLHTMAYTSSREPVLYMCYYTYVRFDMAKIIVLGIVIT